MNKKTKTILIISTIIGAGILFFVGTLLVKGVYNYVANKNYGTETYSYSYDGITADENLIESRTSDDSLVEETDSKIIKTGQVELEADDIDEAITAVKALVEEYDAQVTSERDSGDDLDRYVNISIKVDESKYTQLYEGLKKIDGKLVSSSTNSQDVTEEYIDLTARLGNLEATEEQLVEILSSATNVEETLAVYNELSRVRGEIESLEGQIKYIEEKTDFSTINVYITQSTSGINIGNEKWEPLGVIKTAINTLFEVVKGLLSAVIWAAIFSPIFAIPYIIYVVLKKKAKK